MTDQPNPTTLPTGEKITLRETPWRELGAQWEATATVRGLPVAPDCHGVGATPAEATRNLIEYVGELRRRFSEATDKD